MTSEEIIQFLIAGENTCIEFKRCGGNPEADIFESYCALLNRDGGDLFLGISDDGKVIGVPEKAFCEITLFIFFNSVNDKEDNS